PFPMIVIGAGLLGWVGGKWRREQFLVVDGGGAEGGGMQEVPAARPGWGHSLRVLGACLALWWLPVVGLGLWLGWNGTHAQQGLYFSKAAMVTVGGAYAVLPYVSQQAVDRYGWLTMPQMID